MEMVVVVLTAQALKNWLTALTRSHLVLPTYGDAASALLTHRLWCERLSYEAMEDRSLTAIATRSSLSCLLGDWLRMSAVHR